ncbi:G2-specific serine/threonine protein kinase [Aspergillus tanneri]|uniref:non-specific serine/threonine protein kinase n=1 Tax=Aspergillus tanneri TaxID=1220188 RepID=A0A5M9M7J3_9EURO|nr:G2-specific serine/threonine protein kinase [Aspergillus tanneri]KAA8641556.1 G2-specific serine/threonine protein kinase [Aspergillus tanneri]
MSPEICARESYGFPADIWALGCTMYELCQQDVPFNAQAGALLVREILDGRPKPLPKIYSETLRTLIGDCLRRNPARRPDARSLLNHPIIRLAQRSPPLQVVQNQHTCNIEEHDRIQSELEEVKRQLADVLNEKATMAPKAEYSSQDKAVQAGASRFRSVNKGGSGSQNPSSGGGRKFDADVWLKEIENLSSILERSKA